MTLTAIRCAAALELFANGAYAADPGKVDAEATISKAGRAYAGNFMQSK